MTLLANYAMQKWKIYYTLLLSVKKIETKRNYKVLDRKIRNPEKRLRDFLFINKDYQAVGKVIRDLWELRKTLLKQIDSQKKKQNNI